MPHVNHGGNQNMQNCAMCSMAAVIGHGANTGTLQNALNANGQSDAHLANAFGHGQLEGMEQLQATLNSMISFVKQASVHLQHPFDKAFQYGVPGIGKSANEIDAYMQSKPIGSRFAVWGCQQHVMMGYGAHWNYAEHTALGVRFTDYQDNNANGVVPHAAHTFIQPRGESRNDGDVYDNFVVLFFNE